MADFADDFHFADDGNAVNLSLIDGVAKETVAVLEFCSIEIDGVGLLIDLLPVVNVD